MDSYQDLLDSVKALHKAQQAVNKKSDAYHAMTFENSTAKRRASASDRLTDACWDRDKALDLFHCELVNAGMAKPKEPADYEPREITHNAGFGHTIRFKYHPQKPRCVK